MYTRIPLGKTGEIMQAAFDLVTKTELGNLVATAQNLIAVIPEITTDAESPSPTPLAHSPTAPPDSSAGACPC